MLKKILGLFRRKSQFTMKLDYLVKRYDMHIRGAIIVGAHTFNESWEYYKIGVEDFVLFEPDSKAYDALMEKFGWNPKYALYNYACGEGNAVKTLYKETANKGQSNSLLQPANHMKLYPRIEFNSRQLVNVITLDFVFKRRVTMHNFLSIDTQGYELKVLTGALRMLNQIDYILCEVNKDEANLYEGAARISDIDALLHVSGFTRVTEPVWVKDAWSEALYIRNEVLTYVDLTGK